MTQDMGTSGVIRRALTWSALNTIALRMGNLVLGIVLARMLQPEIFGVFAVASSVQAILMTVADLGLSTDLIRARDPSGRAPTVATLALGFGLALAAGLWAGSEALTEAMGSPESATVLRILSLTLVLAGLGVVPYAYLQREFAQRKLFLASSADFATTVGLTLVGVALGWGPLALAIPRLVAQAVQVLLQFVFAGMRPQLGFDRGVAADAMRFGMPISAANLISVAVLTLDNLVVARQLGVVALGLYVLAFNLSSWPMSALGQVLRSVSLPGFARAHESPKGAETAMLLAASVTWSVAAPLGLLLAALGRPAVQLLYGEKWLEAVPALSWLAVLGALRVVFDVLASYLYSAGAARSVLAVQVTWIVVLAPTLWVSVGVLGLWGAGLAHTLVATLVVLPGYAVALRRCGIRSSAWLRPATRPLVVGAVAAAVAWLVSSKQESPILGLLLGGGAFLLIYPPGVVPRLLPLLRPRPSRVKPDAHD